MSILTARIKYFHSPMPSKWGCENFHYDEIKMNLLWLAMPQVDVLVSQPWPGNEITASIDAHLSKDLRALLNGPPLEFMWGFSTMGPLRLTEDWPQGFMTTMWGRAREANARLCADLAPNVFLVDFKTKRRFG